MLKNKIVVAPCLKKNVVTPYLKKNCGRPLLEKKLWSPPENLKAIKAKIKAKCQIRKNGEKILGICASDCRGKKIPKNGGATGDQI